MDMGEVRAEISNQLSKLGYVVEYNNIIKMHASIDRMDFSWEVKGAGQKSFEATVRDFGEEKFSIEAYQDDTNARPWFAFARFRRSPTGVHSFLEWLGKALKANHHLVESLHPGELPPKFGFNEGDFVGTDHGYVQGGQVARVKVETLAHFSGTSVLLADVGNPSAIPWFVADLQLYTGRTTIITDGDFWYPIVGQTQRRVLISRSIMVSLELMNQRDKALIKAAIVNFVNKLEKPSDQ